MAQIGLKMALIDLKMKTMVINSKFSLDMDETLCQVAQRGKFIHAFDIQAFVPCRLAYWPKQ